MIVRPRRSVLYMPGSNARALEKARALAADAVILDLEDAVAPDAKIAARAQVADIVKGGGFGRREVVIRINGLDTEWGEDDLAAACAAGPDAILLPKVDSAATLISVGTRLSGLGAPAATRIWAMIETARAILEAPAIAAAARLAESRFAVMVMGTNDLAKETRARIVPGRAPMVPWLMTALAAARMHGLDIIDGVYNELQDSEGFARECAEARDMGFDGKTLIHPNQIEACNAAFSPSESEVAAARRIVEAFALPENAGLGAIKLDGRMVELLHAEMAKRTLALFEAANGE